MALDLFSIQQQIKTFVDDSIAFPVYTGGVEEARTLAATNGILTPHVVLRFGSRQPYLADTSFAGARFDGKYSTVDALCVGESDEDARQLASYVSNILLGYQPGPDASQLNDDWGGGTFTVIAENSRPQFYISWASFRFNFNLSDVGA